MPFSVRFGMYLSFVFVLLIFFLVDVGSLRGVLDGVLSLRDAELDVDGLLSIFVFDMFNGFNDSDDELILNLLIFSIFLF